MLSKWTPSKTLVWMLYTSSFIMEHTLTITPDETNLFFTDSASIFVQLNALTGAILYCKSFPFYDF